MSRSFAPNKRYNNNNNNNAAAAAAEKAAAEKTAVEKAAAEAKVHVIEVAEGSPASGLLRPGDLVLTINGVKVTGHSQGIELFVPCKGDVVFYVLRPEFDTLRGEFVTVTMHKLQADVKLGVTLHNVNGEQDSMDPALYKAFQLIQDLVGDENEGEGLEEWKMMPSAPLKEKLRLISDAIWGGDAGNPDGAP